MKLWQGMSQRFLVALLFAGIAALLAAQTVARVLMRESMLRGSLPLLENLYAEYALPACEASPGTFALRVPGGVQLDAYDDRTLRSRNPSSPPVPSEELPPPGGTFIESFRRDRGALTFRMPSSGPCALVRLHWAPRPERTTILHGLVAAGLFVLVVAGGCGVLIVIRPFVRRIEELRRAAERVGDEGEYVPATRGASPRDELDVVAASLDRAHARIRRDAAALELRQRALERSLADVAHDLRTPLAALRLTLEELERGTTDPALRATVARAFRETVYLSGLTSNLHLASQLQGGWSPTSSALPVDLAETVRRVVDRARAIARREGIEVEGATPEQGVPARGDPTAIEQALTNVLENAVLHGAPGGHVAVVLEEETDGHFSLTVTDDGPGVDGLDLPRLGERTFRSDEARQRDPRGRGLGLAITHEVCTRTGWELRFEHASPRGLRVCIRGPVLPPEDAAVPLAAPVV